MTKNPFIHLGIVLSLMVSTVQAGPSVAEPEKAVGLFAEIVSKVGDLGKDAERMTLMLEHPTLYRSLSENAVAERAYTEVSLKLATDLNSPNFTRQFLAQLNPAVRIRLGTLLKVDVNKAARGVSVDELVSYFLNEHKADTHRLLTEARWFESGKKRGWNQQPGEQSFVETILETKLRILERQRVKMLMNKHLSRQTIADLAEILGLVARPSAEDEVILVDNFKILFQACSTVEERRAFLSYEIMSLHRWMAKVAMRGYANHWVADLSVSGSERAFHVMSRGGGGVYVTNAGQKFELLVEGIKKIVDSYPIPFFDGLSSRLGFGGHELALSSQAQLLLDDVSTARQQLNELYGLARSLREEPGPGDMPMR